MNADVGMKDEDICLAADDNNDDDEEHDDEDLVWPLTVTMTMTMKMMKKTFSGRCQCQ